MEESTTYQYIIEQGELKDARTILLKQGAIKFGSPSKRVRAAFQELEDLPRLHRMAVRLLTADSWNDLLDTR